MYTEAMESILDGIAVIEKIANGGSVMDNGAPAYWQDAEDYFSEAAFCIMYDQDSMDARIEQHFREHPFQ